MELKLANVPIYLILKIGSGGAFFGTYS